jgi:hypothetical protein
MVMIFRYRGLDSARDRHDTFSVPSFSAQDKLHHSCYPTDATGETCSRSYIYLSFAGSCITDA